MRRLVIILLAVLAACAPAQRWRNPNLPENLWSSDETQCRREAERDLGPDAYEPPGGSQAPGNYQALGNQGGNNPIDFAQRSDNRKQFDRQVASCMERKGYVEVR